MLFFSNLQQHNGFCRWLWLLFCCIEMMWTCWGISVSFPYEQPIYVAPGRMLVLQAQLKLNPGESVRLVTWDLRRSSGEKRLDSVNYPDINNVIQQIDNFTAANAGSYVLTVTDGSGDQTTAAAVVRLSQKPPHASLSLQCNVVTEGALWEGSPVFSWWVNGSKMTNQTANLSADGSRLYLSGSLDSNYTCAINSSQGSSSVQSTRDPEPDPEPCPDPPSCPSGCIIIAVIEAVVIVVLVVVLCRIRIKKRQRSQETPK